MTPRISRRRPGLPPGGSLAPSFALCLGLLTFALCVPGAWGQTPGAEERIVSLRGPDGVTLEGFYFPADRPGPGLVLLPQCSAIDAEWQSFARRLAGEGLHVLTFNYRGLGGSEGAPWRWTGSLDEAFEYWRTHWDGDVLAAAGWLGAQAGVDTHTLLTGGASCGAYLALRLAKEQRDATRAVFLLSGFTDGDGRAFVADAPALPLMGVASVEDTVPTRALEDLVARSAHPHSRLVLLEGAGHGSEMLEREEGLTALVLDWLREVVPAGLPVVERPPPVRRIHHIDTYHGVRIPDPYRWLEEMDAPEPRRWVEAADRRARDLVGGVEVRNALRDEVLQLSSARRYRPPWKRGDRYFYLTYQSSGGPGTSGTQAHMREGLEAPPGGDRILLAQEDLPEGTVLTRIVPGPLGRLLVYGAAREGSRWETLRVFDVEGGRTLADRLDGVNSGASTIVWTPDGEGFYYERFEVPSGTDARTALRENERVMYHAVGTAQGEDPTILSASAPDRDLTVGLGEDGRWLVVTERDPESGGHRVLVADRRAEELSFHPLVDDASATFRFIGGLGDELWFETDRDAPNRKVSAVDLSAPSSGGSDADREPVWRDLVPESSEAINTWLGARRVGRYLVVGYLVDARTEWRVFGSDGRLLRTLELPRLGPVWSGFQPSIDAGAAETFCSLSGLTDPGSIYRLDLETGHSTLFARPDLGHDSGEFITRQVLYAGRDGTRIPMYVVHRRGLELDGRTPVIMYGYGFGAGSAEPWFQPHLAAWLRMGGMWALPNIRGGGEYGEEWHRAGSGRNKPVAIDDYLAAAEWLIEEGYTSPDRMILNASSAGGAVGGGALVQRPDLFGAAILDYPVLDMLRYDRFTGGRSWRNEFGTADDPKDFRALLGYSPYHNIRLHRCYPPTFVSPGELDEVTPPLHAYKFVAALQHAQGCDEPILLRTTWGAGHSSGSTPADSAETWADQLAFLVQVLGLHEVEQRP